MAVHVVDELGELLASVRVDPVRRTDLIPLLHEGASIYAGRGSAACGRIRARVLATFGEVGLPVAALPFVIEALRTELNPEIVAGAAIAARGLAGSDRDLGRALVQALDNLRGRDAPVALPSDREESTALLEILASLRWQPAVTPDLVDAVPSFMIDTLPAGAYGYAAPPSRWSPSWRLAPTGRAGTRRDLAVDDHGPAG